jgi:acyl-CoA synthetase (AMP-forming)/AMP-acid ligase II
MLIHDYLRRRAESDADGLALISGSARLTFGKLWDMAGRMASYLVERGVQPGDRVAVLCANRWPAAVAVFGALRAGAVLMPVSPQTKTGKLTYLLKDATPTCLIADVGLGREWLPALADDVQLAALVVVGDEKCQLPAKYARVAAKLDDVLERPRAPSEPSIIDQDLAAIVYTSGSTGEPKGVMLSHLNMVSALESVAAYLGVDASDTICSALSLAYSYGLHQLFLATKVGATLLLEPTFTFPVQVLDDMEREGATVFPAVPTYFSAIASIADIGRFRLDRIRLVTSAAAALADRQLAEARALFPKADFLCMYGLTECKRVSYLPPEDLERRPGSVGKGMPNQEVYLVDESGTRLPPGSTGEVVVRGSHVMRGYWRKPIETAARLRPGRHPGDVLLFTGDVFRTDRDGYLYFVGRKDDIIKCGGEKVSPREVENVIMDLPSVLEAAVIGVDDGLLGQAVKAFVVTRFGLTTSADEIIRHCRERLEPNHVPKHVAIVGGLPRNNSSKIDKIALRKWDCNQ